MKPGGSFDLADQNTACLLVHNGQSLSDMISLTAQGHRLDLAVLGRHLHRHAGLLQDLLQGVALGPDDVLVLGLAHLN